MCSLHCALESMAQHGMDVLLIIGVLRVYGYVCGWHCICEGVCLLFGVCVRGCVHACVNVCIRAFVRIGVCVCVCLCVCVCVCVFVCVSFPLWQLVVRFAWYQPGTTWQGRVVTVSVCVSVCSVRAHLFCGAISVALRVLAIPSKGPKSKRPP